MIFGNGKNSFPVLSVITLVILFLSGCGKKEEGRSESISEIQKREGVPVRVLELESSTLKVYEQSGGTVEGYFQATLSAGVPASISRINYATGNYVKKGSVIVALDVNDVNPQYKTAKAQFENARKEYERVKVLFESGGASESALDGAKTGLRMARAAYQSSKKAFNAVAPFSGRVTAIHQNTGTKVGPGAPLADIATLKKVRVIFYVNETIISAFEKGQECHVLKGGDTLSGKIADVAISGNSENHNFRVEAVLENKSGKLRPGMFVTVYTVVEKAEKAVAVPFASVFSIREEKFVYIIKDGKALRRKVVTGLRTENGYEIVSGIAPGDKVVIEGGSQLADGELVKTL
ncbi:MAG: efflux RND transporter periplasmic adaptor subunit [Fibrobacterota bacterium]